MSGMAIEAIVAMIMYERRTGEHIQYREFGDSGIWFFDVDVDFIGSPECTWQIKVWESGKYYPHVKSENMQENDTKEVKNDG